MEIILVVYLKARPLALCTIQIITTIPITKMYLLHYIYVHFQPICKYTTTKNRHFQPVRMNFELKSNTSTKINEGQAKVQLPPIWKMQMSPHQVATNEMGKTKLAASKNQNHQLLKGKITLRCHNFGILGFLFKVFFQCS